MDTPVNLFPEADDRIVYVRPVRTADLPPELRSQAGPGETVYAIHKADGEPLALVPNRTQALRLARVNELTAVSVH